MQKLKICSSLFVGKTFFIYILVRTNQIVQLFKTDFQFFKGTDNQIAFEM